MDAAFALAPDEVVGLMRSEPGGLSEAEAARRLKEYGVNELPASRGRRPWQILLDQFRSPLVYVLLAAAGATIAIGQAVDSAVILAVVIINAAVGFAQEWRAGEALAALAALTVASATVIRDGESRSVESIVLVPGDVVSLEAGDRVPADVRLLECHELQIDEAGLTGESVPVPKSADPVNASTPLADRSCMAYAGTLVTSGRGRGVVVGTGTSTEMGAIQALMKSAQDLQTPLTRKLARFGQIITLAVLALAAATFVLGVLRGESASYMVTAAVALAVGAIPEGLPAVVTITLAIGVSRMARRRAIMRRLPAVETLGSVTVICTDKTGTLTENRMTVQSVFSAGEWWPIGPAPVSTPVKACLLAGVLCNDAQVAAGFEHSEDDVGDPTELALIAAAQRAAPDVMRRAARMRRVQEIPFASELRMMATLHADDDPGLCRLVIKGAVEEVLALCEIGGAESSDSLRAAEEAGDQALRVMAFASTTVPRDYTLTIDGLRRTPMRFLGLQALQDPPRADAIRAVAACHDAGIEVKMITGDHVRTAHAIALQVGLVQRDAQVALQVLSGHQLGILEAGDVDAVISGTDVFARVTAEQKLIIVRSLQGQGHIVAMTGDGVNDAPALKQADIGIAMGLSGTEVAKETADMVLVDDDFATIEAAVEEGRTVYDNLMKFIVWTLPTNLAEGLVVLVAVAFATTLPMLPMQILWVNMATAVALGMMLAFEPAEPDVMRRPPRSPGQSIITGLMLRRIAVVGTAMLAGTFVAFALAVQGGWSEDEARTIAVNALVAMEIAYLLACRSLRGSLRSVGLLTNRWIWIGVVIMVTLQLAFTYLPFMNATFQTAPLRLSGWLPVLALMPLTYGIVGVLKWWERARLAGRSRRTGLRSRG